MDLPDASDDIRFVTTLKRLQESAARGIRRKGQNVRDHPPRQQVVSRFMAGVLLRPLSPATSGENQILISQVSVAYPPCVVPVEQLSPITISGMTLETHHRKRKITLRIITPPDRLTAVMAVAEDEAGTAVLLQLYHQPDEATVPNTEILWPDMVCIIKEPFFKCTMDGSYTLRVDHPNDIVRLDQCDGRVPSPWRPRVLDLNESSLDIREEGNKAVEHEQWATARRLYSSAIQAATTPQEAQLASMNRSLANLRLGRPEKALSDALSGCAPGELSEKGMFRQVRALYQLQEFDTCLQHLVLLRESYPRNKAVEPEIRRVMARLAEQQNGEYFFSQMYRQARATVPSVDCATYSNLVEVRTSPGRGRGLFVKKAIAAGDLILCEKAFALGVQPPATQTILMNLGTNRITMGGLASLWTQVVQKLYQGSHLASSFMGLHSGDYPKGERVEIDGIPIIDSFLVERIISLNAFGAPCTARDLVDKTKDIEWKSNSGIWLRASLVNHSCLPNCSRSFIGDIMLVRATTDIPAGTELVFPYRSSTAFESYADVQKGLKQWGFTCECQLCVEKKAMSALVLQKRKRLSREFSDAIGRGAMSKAQKVLKDLDATFGDQGSSSVSRGEIFSLYAELGAFMIAKKRLVEGVEMTLRGLETLGFVIRAYSPGNAEGKVVLAVEKWGGLNEVLPWAFLRLFEAYQVLAPGLCPRAKQYVEISYGMIKGEQETSHKIFSGLE